MSTDPEEVVDATVETNAIVQRPSAHITHGNQYALADLTAGDFDALLKRMSLQSQRMKQVVRNLMEPGVHYIVPGETDPVKIKAAAAKGKVGLSKAGAEMLLKLFKYVGKVEVVVDYGDVMNAASPAVTVTSYCTVYADNFDGPIMGVGVGACTSWEEKYRWRNAAKACPDCGATTLRYQKEGKFGEYKGKPTFWCAPARDGAAGGGCGKNFAGNDPRIVSQESGKIPTPNAHDQLNTYVKMAAKRARVDGAIAATGSSDLLTQDIEDQPGSTVHDPYEHEETPYDEKPLTVRKYAPNGQKGEKVEVPKPTPEPPQDPLAPMLAVISEKWGLPKPPVPGRARGAWLKSHAKTLGNVLKLFYDEHAEPMVKSFGDVPVTDYKRITDWLTARLAVKESAGEVAPATVGTDAPPAPPAAAEPVQLPWEDAPMAEESPLPPPHERLAAAGVDVVVTLCLSLRHSTKGVREFVRQQGADYGLVDSVLLEKAQLPAAGCWLKKAAQDPIKWDLLCRAIIEEAEAAHLQLNI